MRRFLFIQHFQTYISSIYNETVNNETLLTIISVICACSGFWSFLTVIYQSRRLGKNASNDMLLGLGHDRIINLGNKYIERGYITSDEYENLHDYLYKPYKAMGGNGTAQRVMKEVEKLPIKEVTVCLQRCGGSSPV